MPSHRRLGGHGRREGTWDFEQTQHLVTRLLVQDPEQAALRAGPLPRGLATHGKIEISPEAVSYTSAVCTAWEPTKGLTGQPATPCLWWSAPWHALGTPGQPPPCQLGSVSSPKGLAQTGLGSFSAGTS